MRADDVNVRSLLYALGVTECRTWTYAKMTEEVNAEGGVRRWVKTMTDFAFVGPTYLETFADIIIAQERGEKIEIVPTKSKTGHPKRGEIRPPYKGVQDEYETYQDKRKRHWERWKGKAPVRTGTALELAVRLYKEATRENPITVRKLALIIKANFKDRDAESIFGSAQTYPVQLRKTHGIHLHTRRVRGAEKGYWIEGDGSVPQTKEKDNGIA